MKRSMVTGHVVSYASSASVGTAAVISPPNYLRKFLRILIDTLSNYKTRKVNVLV